jgi:2,3-bisphosphoglycerate-independent phosphoglycerate mutase
MRQVNDSIIFFNFRTDRPRQLTKAIVEEDFEGWERKPLNVLCGDVPVLHANERKVAFKDQAIDKILG